MARVDSVIRRIDTALRNANATDRQVYKRLITKSGGDPLTGQSVTKSFVDTKLDPPPAYQRLARNVVGKAEPAQRLLSDDASIDQVADDYMCLISPTAMTRVELSDPNMLIVFKNGAAVEVFRITDVAPIPFQGKDPLFITYLRSTSRGT